MATDQHVAGVAQERSRWRRSPPWPVCRLHDCVPGADDGVRRSDHCRDGTALPPTRPARAGQLEHLDDHGLRAGPDPGHAAGREAGRPVRRKKIFLGAAVLFTTASLACGFANSIDMLIVLRGLQSIGGGAFMPTATGIVSQQFGRERDRAVGLFSSVFPLGGIIGPVLGGLFVTYWSWRGIFLVNVPLGIILISAGAVFIPASTWRRDQRLDVRGCGPARRHPAGRHVRRRDPRRRPVPDRSGVPGAGVPGRGGAGACSPGTPCGRRRRSSRPSSWSAAASA